MYISEINIYPVKSTKGIRLEAAHVERRGLRLDRRWMVVDESGVFISQRDLTKLALISTSLGETTLSLDAPGRPPLSLPLVPDGASFMNARVWDDAVRVCSMGKVADEWLTSFLGIRCRLVCMPDTTVRSVNPDFASPADIVSLADAFPILLISQASLDDLNSRLSQPVPMNRFRPNIVVGGSKAFEEDSWRRIRLGSLILRIVKPCSRCVTTTVDQQTGVSGKEPLATLAAYRTRNGKVYFGQNAIPENDTLIHTDDRVEILA